VAYMGYFASSLLFANVSHRAEEAPFQLAAAQYAGASISLFSVFVGWLALRPLLETFGLQAAADLVTWLLVAAVIGGYGLLASALYRSGYASARLTVALPVLAAVGTGAFAAVVGLVAPGLRAADSTLALTLVAFVGGVGAFTTL